MPRLAQFFVFFAIALAIVGGVHYYLWVRLVRDAAWPLPWRRILSIATVVLALGLPATMIGSRLLGPKLGAYLAWPGFIWMGAMFILFCLVLVGDLGRLIVACTASLSDAAPANPERRALLGRSIASVQAAMGAALAGFAVWSAGRGPKVKDVEVPMAKLPPGADGMTIVQLTDIHVGPTIGREYIEELVRRTNALEPDVIAITGDLVDGSVAQLGEAVAPLAQLRARYGVYFVTGNHEYYAGAVSWVRYLETLGIRVLRNERVTIGDGEHVIDLAGVDDWHATGGGHGPDLPRALAGRDRRRACVLLAHQPKQIGEAAALGVDLQLSGHTHGGQIWPFGYLVYLQQPYIAGLVRHAGAWLYVSRGSGWWGPPMRLNAPSEITRVVLRAAGAAA